MEINKNVQKHQGPIANLGYIWKNLAPSFNAVVSQRFLGFARSKISTASGQDGSRKHSQKNQHLLLSSAAPENTWCSKATTLSVIIPTSLLKAIPLKYVTLWSLFVNASIKAQKTARQMFTRINIFRGLYSVAVNHHQPSVWGRIKQRSVSECHDVWGVNSHINIYIYIYMYIY